jgi:hypothetical protein
MSTLQRPQIDRDAVGLLNSSTMSGGHTGFPNIYDTRMSDHSGTPAREVPRIYSASGTVDAKAGTQLEKRLFLFPNSDDYQRPPKVSRIDSADVSANNAQQHLPSLRPHRRNQFMFVNLPENCRKGAPYSKHFRAQWLREEIPRIAAERSIEIISHFYLDDRVRLEYLQQVRENHIYHGLRDSSKKLFKHLPRAVATASTAIQTGLMPDIAASISTSQRVESSYVSAHSGAYSDNVRLQGFLVDAA